MSNHTTAFKCSFSVFFCLLYCIYYHVNLWLISPFIAFSPMATPAYVRELQQTSQPQGGGVTPTSGQAATVTVAPQQFLAELQTTGATPSVAPPTGQTTPPPSQVQKSQAIAQAPPAQAPPTQTQYVTAEIQSSPTQSSSQNTPQYIVVTVTGKSSWTFYLNLRMNDMLRKKDILFL